MSLSKEFEKGKKAMTNAHYEARSTIQGYWLIKEKDGEGRIHKETNYQEVMRYFTKFGG